MTNQDHDHKKRECFVQFCKDNGIDQEVNISIFDAFDQIFDRAYALGKHFGNFEQVDVEKAAERYANEIRIPASIPGVMVPLLQDIVKSSYLQGAHDFLGKQEKDADIVIQGWVARDQDGYLSLFKDKPTRDTCDKDDIPYGIWDDNTGCHMELPIISFSDITWKSEPEQVEIIIKRKKNG